MAGAKIALTNTSGELRTDGNDNARVNLPVTGTQAGFSRLNYLRDVSTSREAQISEEGGLEVRQGRLLFHTNFNGAAAAVGTVATRVGDSSISLQTPLVVPNGTYCIVGIRTIYVAAAITSGVLMGGIGISGFWD